MAWGAVPDGRSCGAVTLWRGRPRRAPALSRRLEERLGRPWARAPAYLGNRAQGSDATRGVRLRCSAWGAKLPPSSPYRRGLSGGRLVADGEVEGRVCLAGRRGARAACWACYDAVVNLQRRCATDGAGVGLRHGPMWCTRDEHRRGTTPVKGKGLVTGAVAPRGCRMTAASNAAACPPFLLFFLCSSI
jgi:hypothetical protein